MIARSFESEWLDYVVANNKANAAYRAKMVRLHLVYTEKVVRDVARRARLVSAR